MAQRVTGQRFRQRKLSTKQNLPVIYENELDVSPDDDGTRHIPKVETGVEKGEEVAVISAAQAAAQGQSKVPQLYIPTPEAVASRLRYEDLYPKRFKQPTTYIRFSSTVEDMIGCPYCMTSDDVAFLTSYNQRKGKATQCSEDEFEEVMNFFEEASHRKQPYASVDNTPLLPYEELEAEFDETISDSARRFARDIYPHWKNQRLLKGGRPLIASLKFETNLETDDSDPYVCFRRREVRQVRKTRGRDAQVTEKLKKLRKELEEARFIMAQVRRRELLLRDQLAIEKQIFEQRTAVKEIKRKLGIKENDEELLINQKPTPKPKPRTSLDMPKQIPGRPPIPTRNLMETDLVYIEDQLARRSEAIENFIEDNLTKHQKWNQGWIDETWRPITPPLEPERAKSDFRAVSTRTQLLTPPASEEDEGAGGTMETDQADRQVELRRSARIQYSPPPEDVPHRDQTRFRRRIGRGGRTMVDRRGIKRQKLDSIDERVADRYKYCGDDSEDEQVYLVDWTDNLNIRYRIMIDRQADKQAAHAQAAQYAAAQNRRAIETHHRSASGHLQPPPNAA
ncbi:uncharacterized protein EI97DRAFT_385030 [Westerdykella ornata]|uniref:Enhancer of polycomb-like protein n=1 Tax=Westerdykella ornata TaxID=318751 RepID=A0A6A6JC40_WESOR|nr:uncharacterized protein EI97DRAFT_385030 [Westerdykella ornata]KAF2272759.1 hypothetical protein EI97DRAFT_385030 [Westerdykella ornata]